MGSATHNSGLNNSYPISPKRTHTDDGVELRNIIKANAEPKL